MRALQRVRYTFKSSVDIAFISSKAGLANALVILRTYNNKWWDMSISRLLVPVNTNIQGVELVKTMHVLRRTNLG